MASGTIQNNIPIRRIIYSDSGAFVDETGTNLTLSEYVDHFSFIEVTGYASSISSANKITFIMPTSTDAQYATYWPVVIGGIVGNVRTRITDVIKFQVLSSSYPSIFISKIVGVV